MEKSKTQALKESQEWAMKWYERGFNEGWDAALRFLSRKPLAEAVEYLKDFAEEMKKGAEVVSNYPN